MSAIHDLARELGVSISTVSRALTGKSNVTEATRQRVREAASRVGYVPNRSGRSLRSGTTGTVTFVLSPHPQLLYSESFFMPLLAGAQEAFATHGLELAVTLGFAGEAQMAQLRQLVESRSTDGVMLAWTRPQDERIAYLSEAGFPFATMGRSRSGGTFPYLDIDFEDLARRATERLLGRGHRRMALINTTRELMFHQFLAAGYGAALQQAGMARDPALEREDPMNEAAGRALVTSLLRLADPPTALIVCGETMLAGAWRAIADAGLQPGRDVAVIAVTDGPLCGFLQPTVTSFHAPLRELGARLADILCAAMAGPERAVLQEVWPLALIERASDGDRHLTQR